MQNFTRSHVPRMNGSNWRDLAEEELLHSLDDKEHGNELIETGLYDKLVRESNNQSGNYLDREG